MLAQPVPCVNATDYETKQGKHVTWEDDHHCTTCKRILDLFATRRALNVQRDEGELDV